jgi:hypothetical protein
MACERAMVVRCRALLGLLFLQTPILNAQSRYTFSSAKVMELTQRVPVFLLKVSKSSIGRFLMT